MVGPLGNISCHKSGRIFFDYVLIRLFNYSWINIMISFYFFYSFEQIIPSTSFSQMLQIYIYKNYATATMNKDNNKITELRTILQRESQNS